MEEVKDLLLAWGLPALIPIFIKNEINQQALSALTEENIKEMIPSLGPRALFLRSWRMWRAEFATDLGCGPTDLNLSLGDIDVIPLQTDNESEPTEEPLPQQHPQRQETCLVIPDNKLLQLIKENFEATGLVNFVGKSLPDENSRNLLASVICKQILKTNKNDPVTKNIYHQWSQQIKEIFPGERITTYYIPPCVTAQGITRQAKGKLVNQIINNRRKYQKQGVLDVKEKRVDGGAVSPRPNPPNLVDNTDKTDESEDLEWLRNSSEPWVLVIEKWRKTINTRLNNLRLKDYSIEQYFKEYPALQKPLGYILLIEDFSGSYPEYTNNFYLYFPSIKSTLIELLKKKTSKDSYRSDLIKLAHDTTEEKVNLAAILSLPELITPSIIVLPSSQHDAPTPSKKKKVKESKWKPSKVECREAFITHIHDDSYLKLVISKRHNKILEKGFTPQPYIVIVGASLLCIKSYYVVINPDILYNCQNILSSVDTCFKITWSLNLEYPTAGYGPWLFIQKGLYKLSSQYDKESVSVESLMTDCNLI